MSFLTTPSEHTNVIQVDVFSEVKVILRRYIWYLPLNTSPTIILYLIWNNWLSTHLTTAAFKSEVSILYTSLSFQWNNINWKHIILQTIHSMLLYIPLVQKLHQAVCNMERITSAEWWKSTTYLSVYDGLQKKTNIDIVNTTFSQNTKFFFKWMTITNKIAMRCSLKC